MLPWSASHEFADAFVPAPGIVVDRRERGRPDEDKPAGVVAVSGDPAGVGAVAAGGTPARNAARLGALMRLGCTIAGATPGPLGHVPVALEGGALSLAPQPGWEVLVGEEVEKRLAQAARQLGMGFAIL